MTTPKFDALKWTFSCGCCGGATKAFCEIKQDVKNGVLIKILEDDTITVSKLENGKKTIDAKVMTKEEIEAIL